MTTLIHTTARLAVALQVKHVAAPSPTSTPVAEDRESLLSLYSPALPPCLWKTASSPYPELLPTVLVKLFPFPNIPRYIHMSYTTLFQLLASRPPCLSASANPLMDLPIPQMNCRVSSTPPAIVQYQHRPSVWHDVIAHKPPDRCVRQSRSHHRSEKYQYIPRPVLCTAPRPLTCNFFFTRAGVA